MKEDSVGKVLSAAFSPGGTRIATGSSDQYVRIWDAVSGKQIVKLNGLSEGYGVDFTDDETVVVRPHGAVGVLYTARQSQGDVRLAGTIAGMWAFGPPDDVDATPDVMHLICSTSPYIVHPDGLVEYLAGGEDQLLEPRQFMRCKADLTCDVFEGAAHSLTADPLDKATFKLADGKVTLCMPAIPTTARPFANARSWNGTTRRAPAAMPSNGTSCMRPPPTEIRKLIVFVVAITIAIAIYAVRGIIFDDLVMLHRVAPWRLRHYGYLHLRGMWAIGGAVCLRLGAAGFAILAFGVIGTKPKVDPVARFYKILATH